MAPCITYTPLRICMLICYVIKMLRRTQDDFTHRACAELRWEKTGQNPEETTAIRSLLPHPPAYIVGCVRMRWTTNSKLPHYFFPRDTYTVCCMQYSTFVHFNTTCIHHVFSKSHIHMALDSPKVCPYTSIYYLNPVALFHACALKSMNSSHNLSSSKLILADKHSEFKSSVYQLSGIYFPVSVD